MSSWIISELYPLYLPSYFLPALCMDCPVPTPKQIQWIVRESRSEATKMLIFCTRKIPLTKEQFLYNHPIQTLFIVAVIAVVLLFLTSDFMHTNIMLIFINRCLLILSSAWKKHWMVKIPPNEIPNLLSTFSAIGKTLLQLWFVFLFNFSLTISNFINFFWTQSSCDCIAYKLIEYNQFQKVL